MRPIPYKVLEKAMLPLDGTIAPYVPAILDAYARIVPRARNDNCAMLGAKFFRNRNGSNLLATNA